MDPLEYCYYNDNSIKRIGSSTSDMASQNFAAPSSKKLPVEQIIENSIIQAQKSTSGVLYRFCLQVLEERS
ncbi:MAG: hypothetical protein ACI4PK_02075 [Oscillospiraceae bacterium]